MPFESDPYRALGVSPGASLNEIRSAYRRMAKRYHPDTAGDRALPRFLAVQAAYERLVDGDGRLRARDGDGAAGSGSAGSRGPRREPWRADGARAKASRDAWRSRRGGGAGSGQGAAPGAGRGATPGAAAGPGGRRHAGERSRRHTRRATPGSTTYDEAAETPLDPAWGGGGWYGPSSGTYWTINPREYADPRKHGPEYLARARRAGDRIPGEVTSADPPQASSPSPSPRPPDPGSILGRFVPERLRGFVGRHRPGSRSRPSS